MRASQAGRAGVWRTAAASALALALLAPAAFPKEKAGAHVRLVRADGTAVEGELLTVKGRELILRTYSGSEGVTEAVDGLTEVRIVRKAQVLKSTGRGFLIGGLGGAAFGALIAGDGTRQTDWIDIGPRNAGEGAVLGGVCLGVLGGVVGLVAGALGGNDTVYRIRGASDGSLSAVLSELNRKSRRPS